MIRSSNSFKRNISPTRRLPNVFGFNDKKSSRRSRERRWTTGLEKGQLPISFTHNSLAADDTVSLSQETTSPNTTSIASLASWGSSTSDLENGLSEFRGLRSPTPTPDDFSQQDVLQELLHLNKSVLPEANHQYQLSYELAVDNSPLSPSNYGASLSGQITHCLYVIRELITTERKYIMDLTDIIEGYYIPLNDKVDQLSLTDEDISHLFGNIEEIRRLHNTLYSALQLCGNDYQKLGQCFVQKADDFMIYSQFCNNYPRVVQTLAKISTNKAVSQLMKTCQQRCNHSLPLGAYLLKPIQRVLKYSLLLQELVRHMPATDNGFMTMQMAVDNMTRVAEHINEMQKRYDAEVHTQEIQSLLTGWEGRELTSYGDLVLKDSFRVMWSKTAGYSAHKQSAPSAFRSVKDAYVFLFEKLILIVKKKDEGYQYKYHVEVADAQLTEHLKEQTYFQIRQISNKSTLTFQAKTVEQKQLWSTSIKRLLMESLPGLPAKARQLIMAGFTTDPHHSEQLPRSFTLDRKFFKRDERSESPSKPVPKPLSFNVPETKQVPPVPSNTKSATTTPVNNTSSNRLGVSIVQVGTGFHIGNSTNQVSNNGTSFKKDNGFPESPSSGKKGKFRYSTLPAGVPWTRSDSDPNLMEPSFGDKQDKSSLHYSPLSRTRPTTKLESKTTPTTDSTPPETTPTTDLLLPSGSVSSSISSPDLHMEEMELPLTHSSSIEYSDGTSSPPISPLVEPIIPPLHLRSKSVPIRQHLLETIHSVDTTPRTSIIESNFDDLSTQQKQKQQGPSLLKITQILNEMSNGSSEIPLVIPSLRGEDSDSVSSTTSEGLIIEPPSSFDGVTQYTLDTTEQNLVSSLTTNNKEKKERETDKEEEEEDNDQFVVNEIKWNSKRKLHLPSSSSSLIREDGEYDNYHRERNELLFQELMGHSVSPPSPLEIDHEIELQSPSLYQSSSQGELTPRGGELTFNIEAPIEFQTSDRETTPHSDLSLKLISPDQVLLPSTPANYQRQTTPYTSIEDLPSALDDLSSPDTPSTPGLPPTETVRRWHSFHGEKQLHKIDHKIIDPLDFSSSSSSDHSPPKKDKKDKSANESTNKLSFLRNKSFSSKNRPISRPISLVALVHSTRDDSDLVDLSDAIRQLKAHTPDEFPPPPPIEFSSTSNNRRPSLECTSPMSPPPLTITITPPPPDDEDSEEVPTPTYVITSPIINYTPPSLTMSSSASPPNVKKKNRWSQLRSKLSSSSSSSNNSRYNKESSDSSPLQEEELISPSHTRAHSEPHYIKDDKHSTSLFTETTTDNRRRGKQSLASSTTTNNSKEKRKILSPSEQQEHDDTRQRRSSRVQGLAREYSKRIKQDSPPTLDKNPTDDFMTDDIAPRWVKALKEKRRQRTHALTMSENFSNNSRRPEIEIMTSSHDDRQLSPLTPTSINFENPPSFDSPPLTPEVGGQLVSSQSFTADSYRGTNLSPDSAIFQGETDSKNSKKNVHSNLQRFSSEGILHSRQRQKEEEEQREEEEEEEERRRGRRNRGTGKEKSKQKRGWVKSLVSKFNSNK